MPYLLSNLADGEKPNARYVGEDHKAADGELLVPDSTWESRSDWVWDEATQSIVPATEKHQLAWAKAEAAQRLEEEAVAQMQSILPVYRAVAAISRNSADPRLIEIKATDDLLLAKQEEVKEAPTPEAAQNITMKGGRNAQA